MDSRMFITVFKTTQHQSLSWDRTINSKPHANSFKIHFTITLPSTPGFSNIFHSLVSPPKPCMHLCFSPYVLHATSISSLLIWPPQSFLERSIDHKALDYVVFSRLSLPRPTRAERSSSAPYFKKPQNMFLSQYDRPRFTPLLNKRQIFNSGVCKLLWLKIIHPEVDDNRFPWNTYPYESNCLVVVSDFTPYHLSRFPVKRASIHQNTNKPKKGIGLNNSEIERPRSGMKEDKTRSD